MPVAAPPSSPISLEVAYSVRVRVRVRQNAEHHYPRGRRSGNLRFFEESEKAVDNECKCGPVAGFVLRVVGTHQYVSFFLGGRVLVFSCVCTPVWWLDDLAFYAVPAVFSPTYGARKKGVVVLSARGTTLIRGSVGRT